MRPAFLGQTRYKDMNTHTHTHTHTHTVYVYNVHRQEPNTLLGTWYTGHMVPQFVSFRWPHYCVSMLPVYNLQELGNVFSSKTIISGEGVEGVERPIVPRSHSVVQYPCHHLQHHHVCALCVRSVCTCVRV